MGNPLDREERKNQNKQKRKKEKKKSSHMLEKATWCGLLSIAARASFRLLRIAVACQFNTRSHKISRLVCRYACRLSSRPSLAPVYEPLCMRVQLSSKPDQNNAMAHMPTRSDQVGIG
jgi:hypothetical protein